MNIQPEVAMESVPAAEPKPNRHERRRKAAMERQKEGKQRARHNERKQKRGKKG